MTPKIYCNISATSVGLSPVLQLSVNFFFYNGTPQSGSTPIFSYSYCNREELEQRVKIGLSDYVNLTFSTTYSADDVVIVG